MKGSVRGPFRYVSTYIKNKKVQQVNGSASVESLVLGPFPEERRTEDEVPVQALPTGKGPSWGEPSLR